MRYFVAVAEEGSFTQGAKRSHVVQSAASAAVARLERELGAELFTRSRSGIELTEAGRLLLPRARAMIGAALAARDEIDALTGGLRGTVTVGCILTTGSVDLAGSLRRFRARRPEVQVRLLLSARSAYGHFDSLLNGTFDLLLAPMPQILPRGVWMKAVGQVRIAPVCSRKHPLASCAPVSFSDLTAYPHIDFPVGWGNRDLVDAKLRDSQVERSLAVEVVDVATALTLAAGDAGIAFVPEALARADAAVAVVDLEQPFPWTLLGLASATERPLSEAARELRDAFLADGGAPSVCSDQLDGQPEVDVEVPERRAFTRSVVDGDDGPVRPHPGMGGQSDPGGLDVIDS